MEIVHRTTVAAGIEEAWPFVSDLPSILTCMPGAELREPLGDGRYRAKFVVSAGDFSVSFGGIISMETSDDWTAVVRASGNDRMKTISSEAQATIRLEPLGDRSTAIDIAATFEFTGFLAAPARAGAGPVARSILDRFSACLISRFSD